MANTFDTQGHLGQAALLAQKLVAPGKGILAADESPPTMEARFGESGIACTPEQRRAYRELLFTSPGIERYLSGVILSDEALCQAGSDGTPFAELVAERGMTPGVKVDLGTTALAGFPDEKVTSGLDGLRSRLETYASSGARFAKWRGIIRIGRGRPSVTTLTANCEVMARFAALSQEAGLVPISEPEILMDGDHSIERCATVTEATLRRLYARLRAHRVNLGGTLLKVNMVLPGRDQSRQAPADEVAIATVGVLRSVVPVSVPGVVFLSGGQDPIDATARLNAIAGRGPQPWHLSFSFARALQAPVLAAWKGQDANRPEAQAAFVRRAWLNSMASEGRYNPGLEGHDPPEVVRQSVGLPRAS